MRTPISIFASLLLAVSLIHAERLDTDSTSSFGIEDTVNIPITRLDSTISSWLDEYRSLGYWDAHIEILSLSPDSRSVHAELRPGEPSAISVLHFNGALEREIEFLNKEYLLGRDKISLVQVPRAESRLRDIGYRLLPLGGVSRDELGNYHLSYRITKRPELNIDALAAFNQGAGSDTVSFYGHIYLFVPNLDGKGKSIRLNWKRLKTDSELFSLAYGHPWLLNRALKGGLRFEREVVNGNYQTLDSKISLEWRIDWERSMYVQLEDYRSLITYEGSILNPQWQAVHRQMVGLGFKHSDLDDRNHRGFAVRSSLSQELNFEPASLSRLDFRSEAQVSFLTKFYLSQRTALSIQNKSRTENDPSVLKPLGGVNSVRGYDENQYRSVSVASFQHDLYLMLGKQARLLALMDLGIYLDSDNPQYLTGYGLGVQLNSTRGPIRLILATHPGLGLRNSFLHIEYSGGISWIDRL